MRLLSLGVRYMSSDGQMEAVVHSTQITHKLFVFLTFHKLTGLSTSEYNKALHLGSRFLTTHFSQLWSFEVPISGQLSQKETLIMFNYSHLSTQFCDWAGHSPASRTSMYLHGLNRICTFAVR